MFRGVNKLVILILTICFLVGFSGVVSHARKFGVGVMPTGDTLPDECSVGDPFWDSDNDILYICDPADTWTAAGGGGDISADFTQDGGVLVGTGAGAYQEETGATLRTSLGLAIGTDVLAPDGNGGSLTNIQGVDNEWIGGTGWVALDGDGDAVTQNNLRDWGVLFDADGDGSLIDETWYLVITANQEVQDGVHFSFGNDDDASFAWDSAAGVLEIRDNTDDPIFWFDLANSAINAKATTSPQNGLYDSNAAGAERTDEYAGGIGANMTDTTEDAEISDLDLYYMNAGTKTSAITIDGSANQIKPNIPIATDQIIMGGINFSVKAGAYTIGTDDPYEAYGTIFLSGASAPVLTMPATLAEGMSGCLQQQQGHTDILTLTPNTGDYLVVDGARKTAATAYASTGAAGDKICWAVADGTDIYITSLSGTWSE